MRSVGLWITNFFSLTVCEMLLPKPGKIAKTLTPYECVIVNGQFSLGEKILNFWERSHRIDPLKAKSHKSSAHH